LHYLIASLYLTSTSIDMVVVYNYVQPFDVYTFAIIFVSIEAYRMELAKLIRKVFVDVYINTSSTSPTSSASSALSTLLSISLLVLSFAKASKELEDIWVIRSRQRIHWGRKLGIFEAIRRSNFEHLKRYVSSLSLNLSLGISQRWDAPGHQKGRVFLDFSLCMFLPWGHGLFS